MQPVATIEEVRRSAHLGFVTTRANIKQLMAAILAAGLFSCSSSGDTGSSGGAAGTAQGGNASGGAAAGGTQNGGAASGGAQTGGAQAGGTTATGGTTAGGTSATAGGSDSSGAAAGGNGGVGGYVPSGPCSPPVDVKKPIEKLSETGCMSPSDVRKMADFVIPYDVNSPLWSDGANKTRGMVLPQGEKIHVLNCTANPDECRYGKEDDGHWVFPVGTVLIKNFSYDDKLVETRLFVRRDTKTWVGYGYQWNEAQTEATIVPDDGAKVTFNTGKREVPWEYPSRYNCMLCHGKSAGSSLGPETRQLNKMSGNQNLLETLEGLGVFDAPLPKPYLAALPTPYESFEGKPPAGATNEELARSYMHANCAFCHRADGNEGTLDLRWGVPVAKMAGCNVDPKKGGAGLSTYTILTPGKPQESVLWARMKTLDEQDRMPQIASYVVDEPAVKLVGDWISSLTSCQ